MKLQLVEQAVDRENFQYPPIEGVHLAQEEEEVKEDMGDTGEEEAKGVLDFLKETRGTTTVEPDNVKPNLARGSIVKKTMMSRLSNW